MATNGVKTTQDDDGWEVATGNDPELSSESIIPSPYPHERSRATSRPRGNNHEAVETLFVEQMKVVQEIRLKNSHSLATDIRNDKKRNVTPKYTILKRNVESNNDCKVDDAKKVSRATESRLSSTINHNRYNSLTSEEARDIVHAEKPKKQNVSKSTGQNLSVQAGSSCSKLVQEKSSVSEAVASSVGSSPFFRKMSKVSSSPLASPDLKNHARGLTKVKPTVEEELCGCKDECCFNERHSSSEVRVSTDNQVERRSNRGRSLFVMLAKIMTIIFLYYITFKTD